jgi:hypothetical protein
MEQALMSGQRGVLASLWIIAKYQKIASKLSCAQPVASGDGIYPQKLIGSQPARRTRTGAENFGP